MSLHCDCPDWDKEIRIVNSAHVLQSVRSGGGYQYPGKQFKFCPWCGKALAITVGDLKIEAAPVRPRPETNRCGVCGTPTFGLYCAKHTRGGVA
jgi:hypothetical protein